MVLGFLLAHGGSWESESETVVDERIEDGVGQRGIGETDVPLVDRGAGW